MQRFEGPPQPGFIQLGYVADTRPLPPGHAGHTTASRQLAVTSRPMDDGDSMLLFELYAAGRADEISRSGWATPQQRSFFRRQAVIQEEHFGRHYGHLERRTICVNGFSAGRLLVDRAPTAVTLVDMGLLPRFRCRGIGTLLVSNVLEGAAVAQVPVYLEISTSSPAIHLAERLGFGQPVDLDGRVRLTWTPPPVVPGSSRLAVVHRD